MSTEKEQIEKEMEQYAEAGTTYDFVVNEDGEEVLRAKKGDTKRNLAVFEAMFFIEFLDAAAKLEKIVTLINSLNLEAAQEEFSTALIKLQKIRSMKH